MSRGRRCRLPFGPGCVVPGCIVPGCIGPELVGAGTAAILALACSSGDSEAIGQPEYAWTALGDYPPPIVPEDNPMSCQKALLGRFLFYDPRLSANGEQACASCHKQELAFSDEQTLPLGSTGDRLPRNSMGLTNVAFRSTYTWANPVLDTLEAQALVPLLAEFPVELGLSGKEAPVMERLAQLELYQQLFGAAFPLDPEPFRLERVVQALASFERTLLSFGSPYDRFLEGQTNALGESARRGYRLFFSERTECYHCHAGPDLTTAYRSQAVPGAPPAFHNTGLYNLEPDGRYPFPNIGLAEFTGEPGDVGAFRVPTLRNVGETAPYMHDGSIATLREAVRHYSVGGRTIEDGPYAGDGSQNPFKDSLVFELGLSEQEQSDVVAFLESLTDSEFLTRSELADPFSGSPPACPQ